MINIISTSNELSKNVLAKSLFESLNRGVDDSDAIVYYKFPFYKGDVQDDLIEAQMLLLSSKYGIFIFDYENNGNITKEMCIKMDNLYTEVASRIKKVPQLRKQRDVLKYDIKTIFVGSGRTENQDYEYWDAMSVEQKIANQQLSEEIPQDDFKYLEACIEGTKGMLKKSEREDIPRTKAHILNEIQNQIATFDINQKKCAEIDINAPQRIRGLAGSGKTVILAYKAAIYHMRHPEHDILYTFYTKSLGDSVRELIRHAYKSLGNNEDPNWEKISVIHAWGSASSHGVYYDACINNHIVPLTLEGAKQNASFGKNPFAVICEQLQKHHIIPKYELVIIDEGQDFPVEFYRLCRKLCKTQRVCWAYDDFQNIFDVSLQDEKETFGYDIDGKPFVDFSILDSSCDLVLQKCYRTPRLPLIYAFTLGLGIYNEKVLQRIESVDLWESLGFKVEKGNAKVGDEMLISRPIEHTPSYSNIMFDQDCIKSFKSTSLDEECQYIASQISSAIKNDFLLPNDICVICLDNKYVETYFDKITHYLQQDKINTFNLLNASYSNTCFTVKDRVTLSTVNKAKGNETGMVFVCGIDKVFCNYNNVVLRDKLFTSMTRTKGWLYLTGVGDAMDKMEHELASLKENDYKLHFIQPSKEATKTIEDVSRKSLRAQKAVEDGLLELKRLGLSISEIKSLADKALQ